MVKQLTSMMARAGRSALFMGVSLLLVGSGVATLMSLPRSTAQRAYVPLTYPQDITRSFDAVNKKIAILQDRQAKLGRQVVAPADLNTALSRIQIEAAARQYVTARTLLSALDVQVAGWNEQLVRQEASATIAAAVNTLEVPIIVYHYAPGNFGEQLEYLKTHNYTTVDLDQVAAAMTGATPLPPKPVVITFDDGFANQMSAYDLLKQYGMKATFYIINGGEGSKWCVGSGRRYNDPLQPAAGCGDAYLNWDQVRQLDKSELITIGAHTLDHEDLSGDSPERQRFEIFQSKAGIEAQLGHPIRHFCYPYGAYNDETLNLVREAGFITATATLPGTIQPAGSLYTLRRIRDTLTLP